MGDTRDTRTTNRKRSRTIDAWRLVVRNCNHHGTNGCIAGSVRRTERNVVAAHWEHAATRKTADAHCCAIGRRTVVGKYWIGIDDHSVTLIGVCVALYRSLAIGNDGTLRIAYYNTESTGAGIAGSIRRFPLYDVVAYRKKGCAVGSICIWCRAWPANPHYGWRWRAIVRCCWGNIGNSCATNPWVIGAHNVGWAGDIGLLRIQDGDREGTSARVGGYSCIAGLPFDCCGSFGKNSGTGSTARNVVYPPTYPYRPARGYFTVVGG